MLKLKRLRWGLFLVDLATVFRIQIHQGWTKKEGSGGQDPAPQNLWGPLNSINRDKTACVYLSMQSVLVVNKWLCHMLLGYVKLIHANKILTVSYQHGA